MPTMDFSMRYDERFAIPKHILFDNYTKITLLMGFGRNDPKTIQITPEMIC
jgi:hypothetical protein